MAEDILHRQATAGTEGAPELTKEEKDEIVKINLENAVSGIKSDVIPPEINRLIIKQANAGQSGQANLTEEERDILKKYYESVS